MLSRMCRLVRAMLHPRMHSRHSRPLPSGHADHQGFGFGFTMNEDRIVFLDGHPFEDSLSASIEIDDWTHVAGTHGPEGSVLYINGRAAAHRQQHAQLRYHPSADEFLIGRTAGDRRPILGVPQGVPQLTNTS